MLYENLAIRLAKTNPLCSPDPVTKEPTKRATSNPKTSSHGVCRLLKLPAELRDKIYELVLARHAISVVRHGSHHQPGITRANRQLRDETLLMFYARSTIRFGLARELNYQTARSWVRTMAGTANFNAVKQFQLTKQNVPTAKVIVFRFAEDKNAWKFGVSNLAKYGSSRKQSKLANQQRKLAEAFYSVLNSNGGRLDDMVLLLLMGWCR
ncbi:hypothetical protein CKM354_000401800 [Cercospora kikuchii]|uniref:Uncharacterized protein n=1 Tax=Cercospora kikuchii TaxID=84275 RepID=A0A9P3CJ16_9PEZI|nr:uncharacterized protein CKM354_000401800 [Cercospora kikuchii]GIZ40690.1 hypothetical protein CKM354_000401800 [Cercospora kikuchii]